MAKNFDSYDEGLKALCEASLAGSGIAWQMLLENTKADGSVNYTLIVRNNQPCYGEMRPYGSTHPEMLPISARVVHKPGDLHTPFPQTGNPVAVGVTLFGSPNNLEGIKNYNDFILTVTDPQYSPWKKATQAIIYNKNEAGQIKSLVLTDTKVDSTIILSLFMNLRNWLGNSNTTGTYASLRESFPDADKYHLLILLTLGHYYPKGFPYATSGELKGKSIFQLGYSGSYYLNQKFDVKAFLTGEPPVNLSEGTMYERYAYNRPKLQDLFGTNGDLGIKINEVTKDPSFRISPAYSMYMDPEKYFPVALKEIAKAAA